MASDGYHRGLMIGEIQRSELLDRIDEMEANAEKSDGRPSSSDERVSFRKPDIAVAAEHPGGGLAHFMVCGRDLSPQNMTFLHCGYLHQNTRCKIELPTIWNGTEAVFGIVKECRHIEGSFHDVRIVFEEPADLRHFIDQGDVLARYMADRTTPTDLMGSILFIDDQEVECRLMTHHLRETRITLKTVNTVEAALDAVQTRPFDVILCDLNLAGTKGEDAMRALVEAGFNGPIIVLTGETNPTRLKEAKEAGAVAILQKPYDPGKLQGVLAEWLAGDANGDNGPIFSTMFDNPGMDDLIREYMQHIAQTIQNLRGAMRQDDFETVRTCCQIAKETGGSYGFLPLSEVAEQAIKALDASASIGESTKQLLSLEATAKRLKLGRG